MCVFKGKCVQQEHMQKRKWLKNQSIGQKTPSDISLLLGKNEHVIKQH